MRKFSWASLETVIVVEQTMKDADYVNITEDKLHPYMLSVFPNGSGDFKEGNAPFYRSRIMLKWFQEHNNELQ